MIIQHFIEEYRFLSNFYESPFVIDKQFYPTVEHYFQSMKAEDAWEAELIRKAPTPGQAKKMGRSTQLIKTWESIKDAVMLKGLRAKFGQNPDLAKRLIATEDAELQEGNSWGDVYWGVDMKTGKGKNKLGKLLMQIREELKK
jgi:ribA/ribD-fused uncharacterized protein